MQTYDPKIMKQMITSYMEKNFLGNITAMFQSDKSLYNLVGDLLKNKKMKVRMGVTAMMEELVETDSINVKDAIPSLKGLLEDKNPTIRGDGAYIIGLIGGHIAIEAIKPLLDDPHPQVVEIVREFFEDDNPSLN